MRLKYLSREAIDDIKTNFMQYRKHFTDSNAQWFVDLFERNGWLHDSKIECVDFTMNYDPDFSLSDRRNVEIVYEALKGLSPAVASDERLWAGVLFTQLWEYVQYRRKEELASQNERDILNSFFFMRGIKRSCFINCLSRLWWTGYLLYDPSKRDHYAAVDIICERAYASRIVLLSSNNFVSNKNLALGVLDCIADRKTKGESIGRYHFVEANKYLNCIGGISLLDTLSRSETKDIVDKSLTRANLG